MTERAAASFPLEIRLFGPFDMPVAGQPPASPLARKTRHLLALLTLRHNREVERDWLAGTLWPESAERQALYNLRENLSALRHALGAEARRLQSPTPRTLRLDLAGAMADVAEFDSAVAQEDEPAMERAISLYRGPLLEGCLEEWVLPEREVREQGYLRALEALAERAMERSEPSAAAYHLRRVVAVDPLRESAQRGLMRALAADGDYAAAVQVYRDLRLLLHRELNTEPDPETRTLFQQIRDETQRRAQPRPPVYRTPNTEHRSPHLPTTFTRFFGREDELARLQEILSGTGSAEPARLVTLTGPGGTGKTRLAIEAALQAAEGFAGGVWFVPLASLADAKLIPDAVVDALGIERSQRIEPMEQIIAFLHRSDAPVLFVLDNYEHLVEAGAQVARTLLEQVPYLTCLVTSRQALDLEAEQEFPVPPLPTPVDGSWLMVDGRTTESINHQLSTINQIASVALFVDRAQARRPDFQVTDQNAPTVATLCDRLEGIPLAIELAAGWIRMLTPSQMLERLEHRFDLLVSHRKDLSPRHRSLRAAVEWSYNLLTPELRRFFARLSVFRGGWTLEAAEAVCEEPLALDYLEYLQECSLALAEETEQGMRFRVLETLREYGAEQLTPEEQTAVERPHRRFFLALAEQAEPNLHGAEAASWLDRLEREHDNLRAVLTGCLKDAAEIEVGLQLARRLGRFWEQRGHLSEGRQWIESLLAFSGEISPSLRAHALRAAGDLAYWQGDVVSAQTLLSESLALFRRLGEKQGVASALLSLSGVIWHQSNPAATQALLEEALSLSREVGDKAGIARSLYELGSVALLGWDYVVARTRYEESRALFQELGHSADMAAALQRLGRDEEALELYRQLGGKRAIAGALINLGIRASYEGRPDQAQVLLQEGLALCHENENKMGVTWALEALGWHLTCMGELERGRALLEECLALSRQLENRMSTTWALFNYAENAFWRGNIAEASALLEEMVAVTRERGDDDDLSLALQYLGWVALEQGADAEASAFFEECLALSHREKARVWVLLGLARLAARRQDFAQARSLLTDCLSGQQDFAHTAAFNVADWFQEISERAGVACSLEEFAELALAQHQPERAARLSGAAASLCTVYVVRRFSWGAKQQSGRLAALRALLGEKAFAAAWEEGQAMMLEQSIAYALEEADAERGGRQDAGAE